MQLHVAPDLNVACQAAADELARLFSRERFHLVCATGRTMEPLYAALIDRAGRGLWDPSRGRYFNLDEYEGLAARVAAPWSEDPSFARYLHERFFAPLRIGRDRICLIDGRTRDPARFADYYREELFGPLRPVITLLGIGRDGHMAFNEPGSRRQDRMRVVTLTDATIADNFPAERRHHAPKRALTLGPAEILRSDFLFLLAAGASKTEALHRALCLPPDDGCPAGFVKDHPRLFVFADEAAAAQLPLSWRVARHEGG